MSSGWLSWSWCLIRRSYDAWCYYVIRMTYASILKSSGWYSKFRFFTTRGGPSALPYLWSVYSCVIVQLSSSRWAYGPVSQIIYWAIIQILEDFFAFWINVPSGDLGSHPDDLSVVSDLIRVQVCTCHSSEFVTWWRGNIFCVTGPLCGEFTGHRWIPLTKASDAEMWCFFLSAPERTVE